MTWSRVPAAHVLAAALCLGLALANLARLHVVGARGVRRCRLRARRRRRAGARAWSLAALLVVLAGWWWASARLDALDRSPMLAEVGRAGRAVVVVTAPPTHATVRAARAGPAPAVRGRSRRRARPARAPARPLAAAGRRHRRARRRRRSRAGPSTGSTSARGCAVTASTSSCTSTSGGRSAGAAASAASPTGSASRLARSIAPGLDGRAARGPRRDRARRRRRAPGRPAPGLPRLGPLPPARRLGPERRRSSPAGRSCSRGCSASSRWLGELGALAGIGAYVLAVGPQPSVIRAGIAGSLASLAWLTGRLRDAWYALLLGAVALLAWNPYLVYDPGFELSFAAVAAIFLLAPRIARRLEGYPLPRSLRLVVAVSTACGARRPRRSSGSSSARCRSSSVPANVLAEPAMPPLLGLAFATAALERRLAGRGRRARVGQRLARRVHRALRPRGRLAPVRAGATAPRASPRSPGRSSLAAYAWRRWPRS